MAVDIVTTARNIFAKGGVLGFYPGVLPYMTADGLRYSPTSLLAICIPLSFDSVSPSCVPWGSGAIKFASFEVSKVFLEKRLPLKFHPAVQVCVPHPIPTLPTPASLLISRCTVRQFFCAAGAMVACSVVMVPGEVIKTRMQAGMVKNLIEGVTQTLKQDGIGGLFAGYYATLVRDVPYTMLELGLYENIKVRLLSQNRPLYLSLTNPVVCCRSARPRCAVSVGRRT